jgi:hypothetical protein
MTILKFLAKAAMATNLTYKVLITSLLIAGTVYELTTKKKPRLPNGR